MEKRSGSFGGVFLGREVAFCLGDRIKACGATEVELLVLLIPHPLIPLFVGKTHDSGVCGGGEESEEKVWGGLVLGVHRGFILRGQKRSPWGSCSKSRAGGSALSPPSYTFFWGENWRFWGWGGPGRGVTVIWSPQAAASSPRWLKSRCPAPSGSTSSASARHVRTSHTRSCLSVPADAMYLCRLGDMETAVTPPKKNQKKPPENPKKREFCSRASGVDGERPHGPAVTQQPHQRLRHRGTPECHRPWGQHHRSR